MTPTEERPIQISKEQIVHLEREADTQGTTIDALIGAAIELYLARGSVDTIPAQDKTDALCSLLTAGDSEVSERIWDNANDSDYDNDNEAAFVAERIGLLTLQELQEVAQRVAAAAGLPCPKFP